MANAHPSWRKESVYKDEYCQLAIDLLSKGKHLCHLAAKIGIGQSVINYWQGEYPDFAKALEIGKASSEAVHVDLLMNGELDPKAAQLLMRNKFRWNLAEKIKVPGISEKNTAKQNFSALVECIAKGDLAGKDIKSLSSVLLDGVAIDQDVEYEQRISALEKAKDEI